MSDRCHTHKARACQKCAGDAGMREHAALNLWHSQFHGGGADDCSSDHTSPCFIVNALHRLDGAEADARRWKQIAKNFSEDCTVLEREVERLAGVVVKVRELADEWRREIHRGMRDDRDPS